MNIRLSSEDLELINQLTLRLHRALDPEAQLQEMLVALHQLVPCVLVAWTEFNMSTRATRIVSFPPMTQEHERAMAAVGQYAHQSPFPAYYAASQDTSWRMITDFIPIEEFERTEFCKQGISTWGSHQIACVLTQAEDLIKALTLNRISAPFTERDRAALNLIYPHLCLSHYNATAFDRARQSVRELRSVVEAAPAGYAYLGPTGRIEWSTAKARQLWDTFYAEDTKNETGIPSTVLGWTRQMLAARLDHMLPGTVSQHTLQAMKGEERLDIRLVPAALGGWILAMETRAVAPRPRCVPLPQLSDRENEVLRWMTEGKRNTEIGAILGISPRTVEKHVESILRRMGVENRAAAIVNAMGMSASLQAVPSPR